MNNNGHRRTPIISTENGNPLPTSPTFDSEEETAVGEPLIQDVAARTIPKEYTPFANHDDGAMDEEISTETPRIAISVDGRTLTGSPVPARKMYPPVRIVPSRNM